MAILKESGAVHLARLAKEKEERESGKVIEATVVTPVVNAEEAAIKEAKKQASIKKAKATKAANKAKKDAEEAAKQDEGK